MISFPEFCIVFPAGLFALLMCFACSVAIPDNNGVYVRQPICALLWWSLYVAHMFAGFQNLYDMPWFQPVFDWIWR